MSFPFEAQAQSLAGTLHSRGHALLPQLLSPAECAAVSGLYPQAGNFRSRVLMARHGFGRLWTGCSSRLPSWP